MEWDEGGAHRWGGLSLALVVAFACGRPAQAQGDLERAREAVRGGGGDDGDFDDDAFDDDELHWSGEPGAGFFEDPVGTLIGWSVLAPFVLPRLALGDEGGSGGFTPYPYQDGPGFWRARDEATLGPPRAWSLRPRVELGRDFDDLERVGLGLTLEHASRFGLELDWSRWREDLAAGTDELDLGALDLVYRFAQSPILSFRAGLGVNVLDDAEGTDSGIDALYALELYPVRPLTAGLELNLGTLGDATLTHARAELGFALERFALFASFDHYDLDGVELRSFGLGLRGWM